MPKVKWLLVYSYNPNFCNLPVHLNAIDKAIEFYSKTYEKILIAGDFSTQIFDIKLDTFCSIWNLKSLGKEVVCYAATCGNRKSHLNILKKIIIQHFTLP